MSDLFSDLYRYRQREGKNNYEDWLTECLAAILRALPKEPFSKFMSALTGQSENAIAQIHGDISISTQVTIGRGATRTQRPDLIISIAPMKQQGGCEPSQPWLLFENKVASHIDEQKTEVGDVENQLHRYGYWLQHQKFDRTGLIQGLVFVTHQTPVPEDFITNGSRHPAYETLGRNCTSWSQIACLLKDVCADASEQEHYRTLVAAYWCFLERHGMQDTYPEYRDFSALANFIEVVDPFTKLVNEMIGKLNGLAPSNGRVVWASADAEGGSFNAYRFLAKTERYDSNTYVATGIWFPDRGEGLYLEEIEEQTGRPVSFAPKVYIQLANEKDDALLALEGKPDKDWYRVYSDFFTFRDVASFPPEPSACSNAILNWVETEGAKLKVLLAR